MKGYTTMTVYLPEHPEYARIIWPDWKHIYINSAAEPGANIDYLMKDGQAFLFLSPNGKLPEGGPK